VGFTNGGFLSVLVFYHVCLFKSLLPQGPVTIMMGAELVSLLHLLFSFFSPSRWPAVWTSRRGKKDTSGRIWYGHGRGVGGVDVDVLGGRASQ
jgi:hypothetical protein